MGHVGVDDSGPVSEVEEVSEDVHSPSGALRGTDRGGTSSKTLITRWYGYGYPGRLGCLGRLIMVGNEG